MVSLGWSWSDLAKERTAASIRRVFFRGDVADGRGIANRERGCVPCRTHCRSWVLRRMVPTCGCCSLAIQTGLARGCIVGLVDDTAQLPFVRIAAAVEFAPGSLALAAGSCTRRS